VSPAFARLAVPVLGLCLLMSARAVGGAEPKPGSIWRLDLDGAVGPATSDYLVRGIERAADDEAVLVIVRMDTPGGLDGAMRDIIEAILASPVPVATFVSPRGARAASAGTYILYASHIAAMAPATNLGAATPVSIGTSGAPGAPRDEGEDAEAEPGRETAAERKMTNDAAAYIRGLARLRGRNAEWAELAVREAASLSAEEALEQGVIDLTARDIEDLVRQLEGREVTLDGAPLVLELAGTPVYEAKPDWRTEFLATITNPSLVLILGMIGFYGIILEFYNPGSLVPGTVGVICLLLAGYALQLLPVNYAGLALLLAGIGFMVAEALSPSFGVLGMGGVIAFAIGGIILFDSDIEAFRVGWPVLISVGLVTAGFVVVTVTIAVRMRHQSVTTGIERMLGERGTALSNFSDTGQVRVGGEIWEARALQPLSEGDRVIVKEVSGLLLSVDADREKN